MDTSQAPKEQSTEEQATVPLFHVKARAQAMSDREKLRSLHKVYLSTSPEEAYHKISAAVDQQQNLEQNYKALRNSLENGMLELDELRAILEKNATMLAGVRSFLDICLDSIPLTMRSTPESTVKAEKLFNTAELVEAIFKCLTPVDLLRASQVNRTTSKAIANSPTLQDKLHLRPLKNASILSNFERWKFEEFNVKINKLGSRSNLDMVSDAGGSEPEDDNESQTDSERDSNYEVVVSASFVTQEDSDGGQALPKKVGELCRRMLICQPPVKEMKYWATCCNSGSPFGGASAAWTMHSSSSHPSRVKTLVSETGITIGDIYDATIKLMKRHSNCPHAPEVMHDKNGIVNPSILFEAKIQLKRDDPFIMDQMKEASRIDWHLATNSVKIRQMDVYIARKKQASKLGLPIPTYQEFKAEMVHERGCMRLEFDD